MLTDQQVLELVRAEMDRSNVTRIAGVSQVEAADGVGGPHFYLRVDEGEGVTEFCISIERLTE